MQMRLLLLSLTFAGLLAPAASASVIYSITPIQPVAAPGDIGDAFEVIVTNTGPASISVAGFTFAISTTDPDITFTSAITSTTTDPYIFAGDSFDNHVSIPLNLNSGMSLKANDETFDNTGITIGASSSMALGRVFYNVSGGAIVPGSFTVAFVTDPGMNSLSTPAPTSSITIDTLQSETILIDTPEPGALLLVPGGLLALWWKRSSIAARRHRQ
jgi:hypothetical protein